MLDQRPYLLRALREWIVDSGCTPQLSVAAAHPELRIPAQAAQAAQDGRVVLNISPSAIVDFFIDSDAVSFGARFAGVPHAVYVPMAAVLAIFARENGATVMFSAAQGDEVEAKEEVDGEGPEEPPPSSGGSHLRVVK